MWIVEIRVYYSLFYFPRIRIYYCNCSWKLLSNHNFKLCVNPYLSYAWDFRRIQNSRFLWRPCYFLISVYANRYYSFHVWMCRTNVDIDSWLVESETELVYRLEVGTEVFRSLERHYRVCMYMSCVLV